jgi:hypothetical protein
VNNLDNAGTMERKAFWHGVQQTLFWLFVVGYAAYALLSGGLGYLEIVIGRYVILVAVAIAVMFSLEFLGELIPDRALDFLFGPHPLRRIGWTAFVLYVGYACVWVLTHRT